jgi:hypothetical protein
MLSHHPSCAVGYEFCHSSVLCTFLSERPCIKFPTFIKSGDAASFPVPTEISTKRRVVSFG